MTHTIGYALEGILEAARLLSSERYLQAVLLAATAIARALPADGALPGRLDKDWKPQVAWSCLTGDCQLAALLFRLYQITRDPFLLDAGSRLIRFAEWTQLLESSDLGMRGGIGGSFPIYGGYQPYNFLNWATKFFLDAELLHWRILNEHGAVESGG